MMSAGGLNVVVGAASDASDARPPTARRELRPVTGRVLAELPGPRLLWILVWALVPWLNAGVNLLLDTGERSAVWEQSRLVVIVNYAALSFAVWSRCSGPNGSHGEWRSWTYGSLQLGLNRLGRAHLRDDASLVDPSLGLRPLGSVAFMGLHRQIVEVKENQLALARELYAEAYAPVRVARTLEALERQHSLLGAADALEKRARAIHDWPVAEGTWAWVIGIATSVVAITCARLILRPFGF